MSRIEKNKNKRKKIEREKNKEKRNKRNKLIAKIIAIIIIIISIFYLAIRYVGNIGLVVREYSLSYENLPDSFHGFKVIHISDIHYGTSVKTKKLKSIIKKINMIKPDIVVFTGDLVDRSYIISEKEKEDIKDILNEIDTTTGKYAIYGNHDKNNFYNILKDTDFIILDNDYDLIYHKGYEPILITGLSSSILDKMDIDKAYSYFETENNNRDIFSLLILHEPDSISEVLAGFPVNLALAGHSHNGQIRLPNGGSIIKINGAKKYYNEEYKIDNTNLYISGGVGNSKYPFRLFNQPSINFYRLTTIR